MKGKKGRAIITLVILFIVVSLLVAMYISFSENVKYRCLVRSADTTRTDDGAILFLDVAGNEKLTHTITMSDFTERVIENKEININSMNTIPFKIASNLTTTSYFIIIEGKNTDVSIRCTTGVVL